MPPRRDSAPPQVAERGDIHFVFRPKVETDDPAGFADVERFYLVLHPLVLDHGRPPLWRVIVIGRKRLPRIDAHERNWGFVDLVARKVDELRRAFAPATYQTKTRGERHLPAARPAPAPMRWCGRAGSCIWSTAWRCPSAPARCRRRSASSARAISSCR